MINVISDLNSLLEDVGMDSISKTVRYEDFRKICNLEYDFNLEYYAYDIIDDEECVECLIPGEGMMFLTRKEYVNVMCIKAGYKEVIKEIEANE